MKRKRRSIILVDDLLPPPPSRTKTKTPIITHTPVTNLPSQHVVSDMSGSLVVASWASAWKYRNHHIRVTTTTNNEFPEDTTFMNASIASTMLRCGSYVNVHKAIMKDVPVNGCWLEYTITKAPKYNSDYFRGDRPFQSCKP